MSGGIYWERKFYQSEAFLSCGKNTMKFLIALLDVRKRESRSQAKRKGRKSVKLPFINLNRLEMPYETLKKKYRMNQQGITRAIDEALAKGFIEISHHGGLGEHDKTRYSLVEDYLQWKPGIVFQRRERDIKRGYQGKGLGVVKKKDAHKIIPLHTHQNHTLSEDSCTQNHTLQRSAFMPVDSD